MWGLHAYLTVSVGEIFFLNVFAKLENRKRTDPEFLIYHQNVALIISVMFVIQYG